MTKDQIISRLLLAGYQPLNGDFARWKRPAKVQEQHRGDGCILFQNAAVEIGLGAQAGAVVNGFGLTKG